MNCYDRIRGREYNEAKKSRTECVTNPLLLVRCRAGNGDGVKVDVAETKIEWLRLGEIVGLDGSDVIA